MRRRVSANFYELLPYNTNYAIKNAKGVYYMRGEFVDLLIRHPECEDAVRQILIQQEPQPEAQAEQNQKVQ